MRYMTVSRIFTDEQILEALKLQKASTIYELLIMPNIDEINRRSGQENDPMYLAHILASVIIGAQQD